MNENDQDATSVFPVTSSILDSEALARMIQDEYPLRPPVACELLKVGTNDVYLIRSGSGRAVLKAYTCGMRSHDEVAGEVEAVRLLHEQRAPVAPPLRRRDGSDVLTVNAPEGPRHLALFAYADGEVGDFGREHIALLGRTLAEIHVCADRMLPRPYRRRLDVQHMVREPIELIRPVLTEKRDVAFLDNTAEEIERAVAALPATPPAYGLCHGDTGGYNTHVDERGSATHFDFDFCGYGWRAYDVAVFRWSRHRICDATTAERHWQWFADEYESVRPLTPEEHRAIPYFVVCRSLWLTGLQKRMRRPGVDRRIPGVIEFMRKWQAARWARTDFSQKGKENRHETDTGNPSNRKEQ